MNAMSEWLSRYTGLDAWAAMLIVIALLTVVANQVAQVLLRQAVRVTENDNTVWHRALVSAASRPILVAVWVLGFSVMARVVQRQVDEPFLVEVMALRDVLLISCAAWFLLGFIGQVGTKVIASREARGVEVDLTTIDALGKLFRLITVVLALLMIAQTLGIQITGLLALGGVGGIAVGFAAKDILANFFGGLTIYLDRPFSVGEWIRSPDKSIEGTVEYISWRHTRIRGFNRNPIYVPNSLFTNIVVENPSRMSHRRIKETIGLRYDDFDKVAVIVADIKAMLQQHPGIDANTTLIVNFTQFGASSLDLLVYTFTRTTVWVEFHEVKQDVLLQIGQIIARHGAEIAFPTHTLHMAEPPPSADPEPQSRPDAQPQPQPQPTVAETAQSQEEPAVAGSSPSPNAPRKEGSVHVPIA